MNPEQFILMMNALPDAVIDSANAPVIRQKRKPLFIVPAAAACILVLIAAAVYPKLRMQTPEIAEPSAYTTETTAVTTAVTADTTTAAVVTVSSSQTQTTAVSVIATGQTAAVDSGQTHASSETAQRDASADITSVVAAHTETTTGATGSPVDHSVTSAARTGTAAIGTYTAESKTETFVPALSTTVYIPPEPQTLTLPVWRDTWSPAFGYPDMIPPEEPQFSVNVFSAQFMQEVYHWSPAGIRIFDYDYLRVGAGGNAADAALLHAEYSDGQLILTIGLQAADTDLCLGREFLLPVPSEMHLFGRQCSVAFRYVEAEGGPGMEQPSEIEMEIH